MADLWKFSVYEFLIENAVVMDWSDCSSVSVEWIDEVYNLDSEERFSTAGAY